MQSIFRLISVSGLWLMLAIPFAPLHAQTLVDAPDWTLYDTQNRAVHWADLKGQPTIIHFWATWCPYCKALQPGLNRLYLNYKEQGLQVIAISFWEEPGALPQTELDARGMHFKTLVEGDNVARELFNVKGTPTTVFINKAGQIVASTRTSDPDDPRLEKMVQALVAQSADHTDMP